MHWNLNNLYPDHLTVIIDGQTYPEQGYKLLGTRLEFTPNIQHTMTRAADTSDVNILVVANGRSILRATIGELIPPDPDGEETPATLSEGQDITLHHINFPLEVIQ